MLSTLNSLVLRGDTKDVLSPRAAKWRRMRLLRDIVLGADGVFDHLNDTGRLELSDSFDLLQGFGNLAPTSFRRKVNDYRLAVMAEYGGNFTRHFIFWVPKPVQVRWTGSHRLTLRLQFCFCDTTCWGCDETEYTSLNELTDDDFDKMEMHAHLSQRSELYEWESRPPASYLHGTWMLENGGTTGCSDLNRLFRPLLSKIRSSEYNPCPLSPHWTIERII